MAGQQFAHGFDDIGNRKQTKAGGDVPGAGIAASQLREQLERRKDVLRGMHESLPKLVGCEQTGKVCERKWKSG